MSSGKCCPMGMTNQAVYEREREIHYIFSSHLMADQMILSRHAAMNRTTPICHLAT